MKYFVSLGKQWQLDFDTAACHTQENNKNVRKQLLKSNRYSFLIKSSSKM